MLFLFSVTIRKVLKIRINLYSSFRQALKCSECFKLFLAISNLGMISSISVKKILNLGKSFDFYGVLGSAFDGPSPSYFVTTKSLGLASFLTSSKVVGI